MRKASNVLLEAALVAVVGLAFALAANALSPRGLRLSRNYFPGDTVASRPQSATNSGSNVATARPGDPLGAALLRLEQRGLQIIRSNEVVELVHDPRFEQGLVLLIDARDDAHYQAGHIPGAWQLDHYRAEQFMPAILPACLSAQKVVVYCNGGACEDSEFTAIMLRDAGVPRENLFVYAGGITEWKTTG